MRIDFWIVKKISVPEKELAGPEKAYAINADENVFRHRTGKSPCAPAS
ncbi:hypothetical protein [Burkholderia stagnalis]